jgi:hypothetical protein
VEISFDGNPVDGETLERMRRNNLGLDLISKRRDGADSGPSRSVESEKLELVDARFLSMPLYGLSIVNVHTKACGHEIVLVSLLGRWKNASHRWLCS